MIGFYFDTLFATVHYCSPEIILFISFVVSVWKENFEDFDFLFQVLVIFGAFTLTFI